MGGYFLEYNNFIPADPLKTPLHIAPVWYFTPFYSMLRAVTSEMMYALIACVVVGAVLAVAKAKMPALFKGLIVGAARAVVAMMLAIDAKFWGVVVMGGACRDPVLPALAGQQPGQVDPLPPDMAQVPVCGIFVINFFVLGYLGMQPPSANWRACFPGRHPVLLRLLPADALVESSW